MHKVPLLSSYMKFFRRKILIFYNFLLTSAFFQKHFSHKVTWMTSISFEEVTCKVSDM